MAVAEVKAEARIKPTGRLYRQEYVVFLRAAGGKIAFLREYLVLQAAQAMDAPILISHPEDTRRTAVQGTFGK